MHLMLVKLTTGDVGLIVNNKVVITSDPAFGDDKDVDDVAERLASALGVEIHTVETTPPPGDDWNWDDVIELLPGGDASAESVQQP